MISVYIPGDTIVHLGRQHENGARRISFDLSRIMEDWSRLEEESSGGTVQICNRRPGEDAPYLVSGTSYSDGIVSWLVSNTDTSIAGSGECEIRYLSNGVVSKSISFTTIISSSITGKEEMPYDIGSWFDEMCGYIEERIAEIGEIARGVGIENISLTGSTGNVDTYTIELEDGTSYTFDVTNADSTVVIDEDDNDL